MDYNYTVFKIYNKDDILKTSNDILFSPYVIEPFTKYGFYRFLHQSKDKIPKILNENDFKGKTLHLVTNQFEHYIIEYKKDIIHMALLYFNLKNKKDITSRTFFIIWELLISYNLINHNNKTFKSFSFCDNSCGFTQAIAFYRNKFTSSNNDEYNILLYNKDYENIETDENNKSNYLEILKNSIGNNLKIYENNNIEDIKIINEICKEYKNKIDLVVSDINLIWNNTNYQEQESFNLIFIEIYCALNILKKNGNFIIKCYESFTNITLKLIILLSLYFENVYITKPLLSRPTNSERYIVCENFNVTNDKDLKNLYIMIEKIIKTKDKYVIDIFTEYNINTNIEDNNKLINSYISNSQFKSINTMISYLKSGNYFGDQYDTFTKNQINANDYWISTFFPVDIKDLNILKKNIGNKINSILKNNFINNKTDETDETNKTDKTNKTDETNETNKTNKTNKKKDKVSKIKKDKVSKKK